jgi:hydrogenase/urease accessory protein HupE
MNPAPPQPGKAARRQRAAPRALFVLAAVTAALLPTPAYAHGIGGEADDRSVLGFIPLGIEHMLLGWDHLAFIAGVLLLARSFRLSVNLISAFVVGHSATLILATLAGWEVNPLLVDAVIAASVAFVGCVGIFGRPERWGWFVAAVAGFGLIHGLGLATRFDALGLPAEGQLWKVIAFNVGIEIGQATAILAMLVVGLFVSTFLTRPAQPGPGAGDEPVDEGATEEELPAPVRSRATLATQLASAALFMGGSVAAALLVMDSLSAEPRPERADLASDTTCGISDRIANLPGTGGHPARTFYGPDQTTPLSDFGHALGDGFVIVLYSPALPTSQVEDLRGFVDSPGGGGVLAGAATPEVLDQLPDGSLDPDTAVVALHTRDVMTCGELEIDSLEEFAAAWLSSVAG